MRVDVPLLASLTFTLLLLVLFAPLGDVFIAKVVLGDSLLDREGSFPLSAVGGYWAIILLNYRPVSIIEYSVLRHILGLRDHSLSTLPIYALSTFMLIYSFGVVLTKSRFHRALRREVGVILSISSCISVVYGFYYFSVVGYHALSISYLVLSMYLLSKYMLTTSRPALILLTVNVVALLLTHHYSVGVLIVFLLTLMLGYSLPKWRVRDTNRAVSLFLPVFFVIVLLEVFVLPDLEVLAETGPIDEIMNEIISGLRTTILKALRLGAETPQHLEYMSYLKEAFPSYALAETIEGLTKYLLIMLGISSSLFSLRRYRTMTREHILFKLMVLSLSLGILAPAMIYAIYYGALIILAPWVFICLLIPIIVDTYMTWNNEKKIIPTLRKIIRYGLLALVIVSTALSLTTRLELSQVRGELLDASATYLGNILGDYLSADNVYRVFSDHATSANLLLGLVIESNALNRTFPDNISLEPFGELAYSLNCTHIVNMPRNAILVFRLGSMKHGLFGEVAQYYVPARYICFQKIFIDYSLIISVDDYMVFWIKS